MNNNILISIAMTTYNGELFLFEQIKSILSQTYQNFELIICDDASTDQTISIIKQFQAKTDKIKLYINQTNLGFKKNFEQAIKYCNGQYIAFSDQDDIWLSTHLEILLKNISNKDIICSNSLLIDTNGNSLNIKMNNLTHFYKMPDTKEKLFAYLLFGNNFVQGSTCLLKAEFAKKHLPIQDDFSYHDLWFAIFASIENGISYLDTITLLYRQHKNNITLNTKNPILIFKKIQKSKKNFLKKNISIIKLCDTLITKNLPDIYLNYVNIIKNYYNNFNKKILLNGHISFLNILKYFSMNQIIKKP